MIKEILFDNIDTIKAFMLILIVFIIVMSSFLLITHIFIIRKRKQKILEYKKRKK